MRKVTLLDSDILIDVSRQNPIALAYLQTQRKKHETLAISTVTVMELLVGARNKMESEAIQKFLNQFLHIHLTPDVDRQAIAFLQQYRLSHGLLIPDALIAATAVVMNCPLVSKNQRDYRFITELTLLTYPPS